MDGKMSANAFTFCKYSAERILGSAFTLFNTVPLIPMEALARAYALYLSERVFGSFFQFQSDCPA